MRNDKKIQIAVKRRSINCVFCACNAEAVRRRKWFVINGRKSGEERSCREPNWTNRACIALPITPSQCWRIWWPTKIRPRPILVFGLTYQPSWLNSVQATLIWQNRAQLILSVSGGLPCSHYPVPPQVNWTCVNTCHFVVDLVVEHCFGWNSQRLPDPEHRKQMEGSHAWEWSVTAYSAQ
jgi:hypothetical protein